MPNIPKNAQKEKKEKKGPNRSIFEKKKEREKRRTKGAPYIRKLRLLIYRVTGPPGNRACEVDGGAGGLFISKGGLSSNS